MAGSTEWIRPIIDFRAAHAKANGFDPSFTFSRVNLLWEIDSAEPSPCSPARRKLALMCIAIGDKCGESYALHSPVNLFPTAANKMNFSTRELSVIGQWSISSKMPERYDRCVCANGLLLRNTIVHKVVEGWSMIPSFHIPETIIGERRIGKSVDGPPTQATPTTPKFSEVGTCLSPRRWESDVAR